MRSLALRDPKGPNGCFRALAEADEAYNVLDGRLNGQYWSCWTDCFRTGWRRYLDTLEAASKACMSAQT